MGLMLNEFIKGRLWNLCQGQREGQGAAVLARGIEMSTGTRITGGGAEAEAEVEAELGVSLIVRGIGERIGTVIEVGVAVEVLTIVKIVGGTGMMMRSVVEVGLLEAPLLLGVVPVLEGAYPHARHLLLGALVLLDEITKNAPLLQKVFHRAVDLLILVVHLHVGLMLKNEK